MRFLRTNALSIFFLVLFLGSLVGQALAGHASYNDDQRAHAQLLHEQPELLSLGRYVTSSSFAQAVTENWQSEYLQFVVFIVATIWLVQKGSTESKPPGKEGRESDEEQQVGRHAVAGSPRWARVGGWRTRIYSHSLLIVMGVAWIGSWFAQSVAGWSEFNSDQLEHQAPRVSWLGYLGNAQFWESTLQNWQSEFLAVGSLVIFSVYLRERGSTQSKPVGAPHAQTGTQG